MVVANRGEIARRIFRTCCAMGIETVAVFSDADADAPFVHEADQAVALGGNTPSESYLRGEAIIAAARKTGADAVHPGYGFLAENAEFAAAVIAEDLVWVGPPPSAIEAMGSKVRARDLMERAGIPIVPGASVQPGIDLATATRELGFPILVKASAGGGGKGMREVRDVGELDRSVAAARREALAAFGDATIFLERRIERARHVEIQIFGDTNGTVVALGERDCSVQRRYQKVIEESPSPVVDDALRQQLSDAAVVAGRAIGYVGAGTVEFIVTAGGEFFFLEVNTRLQVEHPVTELVTGLDLVRLQLEVANGGTLPAEALKPVSNGHAVEARLYAEDPSREFLPVAGLLERLWFPATVRVDTGVVAGSEVTGFYDPLLAKVIAHAPTRVEAVQVLASALERAEIHGLTTNRDFLVRTLRHPTFLDGAADTEFLQRSESSGLRAPLLEQKEERLCAAAAALHGQAARRASAQVLSSLPSGWRNNWSAPQTVRYRGADGIIEVAYCFDREGQLQQLFIDDTAFACALIHGSRDEVVDLEADGVRRIYRVRKSGARLYVNTTTRQASLTELPRFPIEKASTEDDASLLAPMPGAVIRVEVEVGDQVGHGQPLLAIEAMKMEHEIVAPSSSVVRELLVEAGDRVETGQALLVLDGDANATPDADNADVD